MTELLDNETIAGIIDNEGWPDALEHIRSDEIADPEIKRIWMGATEIYLSLQDYFEDLQQLGVTL
jgi:hypothetical protein